MHDNSTGDVDVFSRSFGQNLRDARLRKGWSQRHLADVLESRGVRLDPSAVTRIERGSRDVKLREAAVFADCLDVELQQLMSPNGLDPLAMVLELLRNAEGKVRVGRSAFAEMALNVHAADALLQLRPAVIDELRRHRGSDEALGVHELLVQDLRESVLQQHPIRVSDADERLLGLLQHIVCTAVEDLFTGAETFGAVATQHREVGSDPEALSELKSGVGAESSHVTTPRAAESSAVARLSKSSGS
jgi:transcriptional regulator with XRE-family HTH domain